MPDISTSTVFRDNKGALVEVNLWKDDNMFIWERPRHLQGLSYYEELDPEDQESSSDEENLEEEPIAAEDPTEGRRKKTRKEQNKQDMEYGIRTRSQCQGI